VQFAEYRNEIIPEMQVGIWIS